MGDPVQSGDGGGSVVIVWVVPGARRAGIAGVHGGAVRVRVSQPPERGRANRAVADLLESVIGVRPRLVSGAGSRRKRYAVDGVDAPEVRRRLGLEA